MYIGRVYIEPQDILERLSEEDKKRFNQCVFTKAEIMMDGSVDISYMVFKADDCEQDLSRVKFLSEDKDKIIDHLLDMLEEEHMGMYGVALKEIEEKFGYKY